MKFAVYRKSKGMSQGKLAELAGVSKQTIFDIEHGKSIRLNLAMKIAKAMNYPLNAEPIVEISNFLGTMPIFEAKKLAGALNIPFDDEDLFGGEK